MEPHKILIIDDDKEVAESIAIFLDGKGHRTLQLYDVTEETYQFIRKESPDLIILDILLPSADGIEVLKRLKGEEETKGIPVVICSVVRQKKRVVEGLDAGASDFLTKPFEVEELFARATSALMAGRVSKAKEENERLETLRRLTETVTGEFETPVGEMRRHIGSLRGSREVMASEGAGELEAAARSLDEVERVLGRLKRGGGAAGAEASGGREVE